MKLVMQIEYLRTCVECLVDLTSVMCSQDKLADPGVSLYGI